MESPSTFSPESLIRDHRSTLALYGVLLLYLPMTNSRNTLAILSLAVKRTTQTVPLGAACLCSAIKADSELSRIWQPVIIEGFVFESDEALIKRINDTNPQIIGFSIYVWNADKCMEIAATIKKESPHIRLIAGGAEVTARPEDFIAMDLFDFVIAGEGEQALIEALKQNRTNEHESASRSPIAGVFRKGQIPISPYAALTPPQSLPSPYLDRTLDMRAYEGLMWEAARGCPFRCGFCYESGGTGKVRKIPISRLEKELEMFIREDAGLIGVLDPTFNCDPERAIEILRMLKQKAPGLRYTFEVRAELLDKTQAELFAELDCSVQIGIQSTNPAALANVNRSYNATLFAQKIGLLNRSGVSFGFDLIYGIPGDTLDGFRQSLSFALTLQPNHLDLFPLSVLPGTELRRNAAALGLEFDSHPPYTSISSPGFDTKCRRAAADLCRACDLFYNQGRAVAWFLSCVKPLKQAPSEFLEKFYEWAKASKRLFDEPEPDSFFIEKLQLDFIRRQYMANGMTKLLPAAKSIIRLHAAYGRANIEGHATTLELEYDPDQLFHPLSLDLKKFSRTMEKHTTKVRVSLKGGQVNIDY
jgi:hypothetical protein